MILYFRHKRLLLFLSAAKRSSASDAIPCIRQGLSPIGKPVDMPKRLQDKHWSNQNRKDGFRLKRFLMNLPNIPWVVMSVIASMLKHILTVLSTWARMFILW